MARCHSLSFFRHDFRVHRLSRQPTAVEARRVPYSNLVRYVASRREARTAAASRVGNSLATTRNYFTLFYWKVSEFIMLRAFARTQALRAPGRADVDLAMTKWWTKKRPAEGQVRPLCMDRFATYFLLVSSLTFLDFVTNRSPRPSRPMNNTLLVLG